MTGRAQWIRVLFFVPLLLAVGLVALYVAMPRVGYCFDAAFEPSGRRVFVTAGQRGLHVLAVSHSGRLTHVHTYFDGGYYRYVELVGDRAYVANSQKGLEILDIGGSRPRPVWVQSGYRVYGLHVEGQTAYLACEEDGLVILDITNPDRPQELARLATGGRAWDVTVLGDYAYVADRDRGLVVIDVSPVVSFPREVGALSWSWSGEPMAEVIDGAGDHVYIAAGHDGLLVVDVSDPRQPELTLRYDPGEDSWGEGVVVRDQTLFVSMVDDASPEHNGLHVFDLAQPELPVLLARYPLSDGVENLAVRGSHLALANTMSGLALFDIGQREQPVLVDTFPGRFWRTFTRWVP